MFSGLLQDWATMDGAGTAAFAQARPDWLDLEAYADVLFWLEVRAIQNPGAGNVVLTYETAPALEESLFQPMGAVTLAASSSPVRTEVKSSNGPVPLARFVRWKLAGTAAGNWSVTFRIFTMANSGRPGGFDLAALPLSGWWRGSYVGSPWTASASAGSSAANGDLSEATNPPAIGTALGGFTPASFDGTNDEISSSSLLDAFVAGGTGSALVLFLATQASAAAPAGQPYDDPGLVVQSGGGTTWGVNYSTAGVRVGFYDGAWQDLAVAAAVGVYHLAQVKWDGASLWLRVDSGSWSSLAAGACNPSAAGGVVTLGRNYSSAAFFQGRILETVFANAVLDDATFDKAKDYVNARYGLTL
jgi:hypothetical protein